MKRNKIIVNILYFLLLFSFIFPKTNQQTIQIQNENNNDDKLSIDNKFIITVCIGTPKQCFPFLVTTYLQNTFILSSEFVPFGFDYKKSKTYHNTNITLGHRYGTTYISGYYIFDTLSIPSVNIDIPNFKIILVNYGFKSNKIYGVIGLGNDYTKYDTDSNFILKLFTNNNIKYKTVSITNNNLYIGNDPFQLHKLYERQVKRTCDLNTSSDLFYCFTENAMIYNDKELLYKVNKQKLYFNTQDYHIYVPYDFFFYIIADIFYTPLTLDDCQEITERETNSAFIKCNENGMKYADKIKIRIFIDKWSLTFDLKSLFNSKGESFIMKSEHCKNDWVFGNIILNKYLISFDKENNKVIFNTKKTIN